MSDYKKKGRGEVEISPLMQELRDALDAAGFHWYDESEEFESGDYLYHMERTKVVRNPCTMDHEEIASCIYGYSGAKGYQTGSSYGWPYCIEGWPSGQADPEPMTVEEITEAVKKL